MSETAHSAAEKAEEVKENVTHSAQEKLATVQHGLHDSFEKVVATAEQGAAAVSHKTQQAYDAYKHITEQAANMVYQLHLIITFIGTTDL